MADIEQEVGESMVNGAESEILHKCDRRMVCSCSEHSVSGVLRVSLLYHHK